MFTNNYQVLQRQSQMGGSVSVTQTSGSSFSAAAGNPQEYTGLVSIMRYARCKPLLAGYVTSVSADNTGLWFGRGATPATENDYTLEDLITSGLSIVNNGRIETTDGKSTWTWTATYSVKNTSESTINIYELGLFGGVKGSNNNGAQVLLHRKVLTEPITILPNETKIISYSISFHQNGDVS